MIIAATGRTERHSLMLDQSLRPMFIYLHAPVVPTGVYAASGDWASNAAEALARRVDRAAGWSASCSNARRRGRLTLSPTREAL